MKLLKTILILVSVVLSFSCHADDIVCKGRVVSAEDLEPFFGVTIKVEGTKIATASDLNGNFKITAPEGSKLVLTYIGCETQKVKAKPNLGTITLQYDVSVLDDKSTSTEKEKGK